MWQQWISDSEGNLLDVTTFDDLREVTQGIRLVVTYSDGRQEDITNSITDIWLTATPSNWEEIRPYYEVLRKRAKANAAGLNGRNTNTS